MVSVPNKRNVRTTDSYDIEISQEDHTSKCSHSVLPVWCNIYAEGRQADQSHHFRRNRSGTGPFPATVHIACELVKLRTVISPCIALGVIPQQVAIEAHR